MEKPKVSETFGKLDDIHSVIEEHQGPGTMHLRLLKIGEEFGEVVETYISQQGGNKRKLELHRSTRDDIARELCDVAITALVAIHDWVNWNETSPERFFRDHLDRVYQRVHTQGS